MNITIQPFKIPNDLAPTYLLELIEKSGRTRNLRNSENILKISRHGTNTFGFLPSPPPKSGTLCQRQ